LAKGKKKFRFRNKLMSLDATVIDLCAEVFDWARFRHTKGAVKRKRQTNPCQFWRDCAHRAGVSSVT
jgi:hypothetical protein